MGPITTRQFLILLVAGGLIFLSYRFGDTPTFALTTLFVGSIASAFAFGKVNGQNFHYFLLNIIQTMRQPGKRRWRKLYSEADLNYFRTQKVEKVVAAPAKKQAERRHIRDLALIVNTGGYYQGEDE